MNNITENIPTTYSAKIVAACPASSFVLPPPTPPENTPINLSNTIIDIQHTLVQSPHTTSLLGLIEQELKEFANEMIARQIPPDHELDMVITNNLWNIYDHGFPD
jgi:hypothetical protein